MSFDLHLVGERSSDLASMEGHMLKLLWVIMVVCFYVAIYADHKARKEMGERKA